MTELLAGLRGRKDHLAHVIPWGVRLSDTIITEQQQAATKALEDETKLLLRER